MKKTSLPAYSFSIFAFSNHPFSIQLTNLSSDFSSNTFLAMTSNLLAAQPSPATLGVPPSTPARQIRSLRPRSPLQASPGFVLTGSDSRRRITRECSTTSSRPTSPTNEQLSIPTRQGKRRVRDDDDVSLTEPEASTSKKKQKKNQSEFFHTRFQRERLVPILF